MSFDIQSVYRPLSNAKYSKFALIIISINIIIDLCYCLLLVVHEPLCNINSGTSAHSRTMSFDFQSVYRPLSNAKYSKFAVIIISINIIIDLCYCGWYLRYTDPCSILIVKRQSFSDDAVRYLIDFSTAHHCQKLTNHSHYHQGKYHHQSLLLPCHIDLFSDFCSVHYATTVTCLYQVVLAWNVNRSLTMPFDIQSVYRPLTTARNQQITFIIIKRHNISSKKTPRVSQIFTNQDEAPVTLRHLPPPHEPVPLECQIAIPAITVTRLAVQRQHHLDDGSPCSRPPSSPHPRLFKEPNRSSDVVFPLTCPCL
ncbi:hypothetical protein J6590_036596 [Homalodisca vitripennis]|nr:hypothetical protein J6590_036596 [Homalodisca vitripennis]